MNFFQILLFYQYPSYYQLAAMQNDNNTKSNQRPSRCIPSINYMGKLLGTSVRFRLGFERKTSNLIIQRNCTSQLTNKQKNIYFYPYLRTGSYVVMQQTGLTGLRGSGIALVITVTLVKICGCEIYRNEWSTTWSKRVSVTWPNLNFKSYYRGQVYENNRTNWSRNLYDCTFLFLVDTKHSVNTL